MKMIRRFLTLALAVLMVLSLGATALAAEQTYTSTDKLTLIPLGGDGAGTDERPELPIDKADIVVSKTFSNIDNIDSIKDTFQISLKNIDFPDNVRTLSYADASKSPDGLTCTWTVKDVGVGTYNVKEEGYQIANHTCEVTVTSNGTPAAINEDGSFDITVQPGNLTFSGAGEITSGSNNVFEAPLTDGTLFVIRSNEDGKLIVLTKNELTAGAQKKIETWLTTGNGPLPGWPSKSVQFYSLKGANSGEWNLLGLPLSYQNGEVSFTPEKGSQWNKVMTANYNIEAAKAPDIAIDNSYTPLTTEVTITKEVTGNMGDVNRGFTFNVTFDQAIAADSSYTLTNENKTASFTLKNGESVTFKGVPKTAQITSITEGNAAGYETTIKVDGETITFPYDVPDDGTLTITVTNRKEVEIDTGIFLDSLPYVLILAVVVVGFVFLRKRKRSYDD